MCLDENRCVFASLSGYDCNESGYLYSQPIDSVCDKGQVILKGWAGQGASWRRRS